jgi:hypothetical protein
VRRCAAWAAAMHVLLHCMYCYLPEVMPGSQGSACARGLSQNVVENALVTGCSVPRPQYVQCTIPWSDQITGNVPLVLTPSATALHPLRYFLVWPAEVPLTVGGQQFVVDPYGGGGLMAADEVRAVGVRMPWQSSLACVHMPVPAMC